MRLDPRPRPRPRWLLVALGLLAAAPARADHAPWLDVSAGYSAIVSTETTDRWGVHGWSVQLAYNVKPVFALVVEASGFHLNGGESLHPLVVGGRATLRLARVSLFGEMLFGAQLARVRWEYSWETEVTPCMAGGVGLDVLLDQRWSWRVFDVRFVNYYSAFALVQLSTGLVVRLGRIEPPRKQPRATPAALTSQPRRPAPAAGAASRRGAGRTSTVGEPCAQDLPAGDRRGCASGLRCIEGRCVVEPPAPGR